MPTRLRRNVTVTFHKTLRFCSCVTVTEAKSTCHD